MTTVAGGAIGPEYKGNEILDCLKDTFGSMQRCVEMRGEWGTEKKKSYPNDDEFSEKIRDCRRKRAKSEYTNLEWWTST